MSAPGRSPLVSGSGRARSIVMRIAIVSKGRIAGVRNRRRWRPQCTIAVIPRRGFTTKTTKRRRNKMARQCRFGRARMRPPFLPIGAFLFVATSFHNAAAQSPQFVPAYPLYCQGPLRPARPPAARPPRRSSGRRSGPAPPIRRQGNASGPTAVRGERRSSRGNSKRQSPRLVQRHAERPGWNVR